MNPGIASFVVACEVVREHEVAATPSDLDAGGKLDGWIKQCRMTRGLLEDPGAALGEEPLVLEM